MNELIAWFEGLGPVMAALVATLFTWGMTAAGAALGGRAQRGKYSGKASGL